MNDLDEQEHQLRLELMTTEIDKNRVDIEKMRAEIRQLERWEPWKALAAIIGAGVAAAGLILGVAHLIK